MAKDSELEPADPRRAGADPSTPALADGWIETAEWELIQERMPIACVDFVPVRRDLTGTVELIGLIRRSNPFGDQALWCHLGGRINRGESVSAALSRHAAATLPGARISFLEADPLITMQWFPEEINPDRQQPNPWAHFGEDPRKHAISLCFVGEFEESDYKVAGEAARFEWFPVGDVGELELWPGSHRLITRVVAADGARNSESAANLRVAYSALAARALNHNTLVWQTPTLALAAQAFLMTIALSPAAATSARLIAAGLNLVLSILCLQLMTKHRQMLVIDREELAEIEQRLRLKTYHQRLRADRLSLFGRQRSGNWWRAAFVVLALVSVAIIILTAGGWG
ncbi:DUF4916 domain-containing protein [Pseudonocardia sp. WMMC193]|uniref:DUF4916 domain-containing protein n=1 Tax=Pseudonocardia sp. WMMC193 TaxID=2911965 RepID=UPI001F20BA0D|nr:DUF4916 domain-containing protein [Pseudonocardia sp. WMMC193]MCF7552198.1 DUF4916 domain-containing protein [Pseudonocardia sp. WMMC193]